MRIKECFEWIRGSFGVSGVLEFLGFWNFGVLEFGVLGVLEFLGFWSFRGFGVSGVLEFWEWFRECFRERDPLPPGHTGYQESQAS
jgi:hypothetical protein